MYTFLQFVLIRMQMWFIYDWSFKFFSKSADCPFPPFFLP